VVGAGAGIGEAEVEAAEAGRTIEVVMTRFLDVQIITVQIEVLQTDEAIMNQEVIPTSKILMQGPHISRQLNRDTTIMVVAEVTAMCLVGHHRRTMAVMATHLHKGKAILITIFLGPPEEDTAVIICKVANVGKVDMVDTRILEVGV